MEGKGYGKDGNIIYVLKNGEGFIKEFDNIWEYKDGKTNGKEKYYYNDILRYECEFFNGKIWNGKEKIFDKNDELIEYELINWKRKE